MYSIWFGVSMKFGRKKAENMENPSTYTSQNVLYATVVARRMPFFHVIYIHTHTHTHTYKYKHARTHTARAHRTNTN